MSARLRKLLGGAEGEVEVLRPGHANHVYHWQRMQISLYGYDLWAYFKVWVAHRPDIWLTWNGGWEFVEQKGFIMNAQSVYVEMDVPPWRQRIVFDEHDIHVKMIRSVV